MKPLDRLAALREKESRLVMGLSSGTSADGVDAALLRISGCGLETRAEMIAGGTWPYGEALRQAILGADSAAAICRLDFVLGDVFADTAEKLVAKAGLTFDDVDLIGSHGQTLYHIPRGPRTDPATLQVGEPDVIAERTRTPVVADFRTRDVAAGGEGAPLVPYVDFLLFRPENGAVALQNLGGIANVTLVTQDLLDVVAFDTGPGNMPLDELARILSRDQEPCDLGGKHAARGRVDEELLGKLMAHPYLALPPPKSTGRETFGRSWVMRILEAKGNLSVLDVLATMTLFVARTIARAYEEHLFPRAEVREVLVSGGGLGNLTLMAHLRRLLHPLPVWSVAERGVDPDLKEAMAFAILAHETLFGNPNNVPAATGARWPVVCGKICP